jgi:hypothetical protein
MRDKVLHVDTVFSLGYFAVPDVSVRLLVQGIWNAGPRQLVQVRPIRYRHRIRLRNEQIGFHLWSDPRELALRQALFHDIVGARSQT